MEKRIRLTLFWLLNFFVVYVITAFNMTVLIFLWSSVNMNISFRRSALLKSGLLRCGPSPEKQPANFV